MDNTQSQFLKPHASPEWDTDISDTSFQNEAAGAVFAVLLLFFFFEDAEGFGSESLAKCLRKNKA